jgi:flagellar biosynthesis/type III secretory pathway protein FliH
MQAIWCWVVEKILSDPRRRVHAPNTTDFKSLAFLKSSDKDKGFAHQGIKPTVASGFILARIEAMPNNTFSAPRRPLPHDALSGVHAGGHALPNANTAHAAATTAQADPEALEAARAQAFAEGLEQGRAEGLQQAAEQQQARQQATQQAQEQQVKQLLTAIQNGMSEFRQDPASLFEPLKKLALRLAEELVLGELSVSPQAIDRLVQRCVDTLDTSASTPLTIQLSPSDLALLREHPETESDRPDHWTWEVDASLLPGSVRIKANDTVVSDFVETRLTALAQSLLKPETPWTSQSAFNPARFSERPSNSLVEDVEPRSAPGFAESSFANAEAEAQAESASEAEAETVSPAFAEAVDFSQADGNASNVAAEPTAFAESAEAAPKAIDAVWDSLPDLALEPETPSADPAAPQDPEHA